MFRVVGNVQGGWQCSGSLVDVQVGNLFRVTFASNEKIKKINL